MIEVIDLFKTYTTKKCEVKAIKGVSFELPDTGFIFLLGKSGCGKSTLLNMLGGLDKPTSGTVNINGRALYDYSSKELDDYRNRHIGFIFQEFNLIDEYSVYDNIAIALKLRGEKEVINNVSGALRSVGLGGYEKRKTSELSGGEKQRIAIARAIVSDTDIILADEPTGNLDNANSKEIFDILKKLSEDKLVIAVTHDQENAEKYADRIITLSDGVIIDGNAPVSESDIRMPNDEADLMPNCEANNVSLADSKAISSKNEKKKGKEYDRYSRTNKGAKEKGINLACLTKLSFINIWKKKIRLIVTVILFCFMLTLFGVSVSALRYDDIAVALDRFYSSEINEFKASIYDENNRDPYLIFGDDKINDLEKNFPEYKFNKIYCMGYESIIEDTNIDAQYRIDYIAYLDEEVMAQYGFTKAWGDLPGTYNEVCISKYIADAMIEQNIFQGVESYEDFLDFTFPPGTYSDVQLKIVGVIDTKIDKTMDKILKTAGIKYEHPIRLELEGSFTASLMVSNEFINTIIYNNKRASIEFSYDYYHPILPPENFTPLFRNEREYIRQESYGKLMKEVYGEIVFADGKTSLAADEIIISKELIKHKAREMFPNVSMGGSGVESGISDEEIMEYVNSGTGYLDNTVFGNSETAGDYKIVGYYRGNSTDILVNEEVVRRANPYVGVETISTTLSGNKKQDMRLMSEFFKDSYALKAYCIPDIDGANGNADTYIWLGLYASLAFGIFAMLMMANFIVSSINVNKKQIGVLRALGMRAGGVVYIFLFEALVVGLIAFIMSVIAVFPVAALLSSFVVVYLEPVQVLVITLVEISIMLLLSLATVTISSTIPIIKKSRTQIIKLLKP